LMLPCSLPLIARLGWIVVVVATGAAGTRS